MHQERILVVDGEKQLCRRYSSRLSALGYTVTWANNGESALHKFKESPSDLIIMDLVLPDSTGFDYLQKFIDVKRDVKVVINTDRDGFKADFHSWFADAFLMKSADVTELTETVETILHPVKQAN
jgi:DNA-binding response OmpR family regulator